MEKKVNYQSCQLSRPVVEPHPLYQNVMLSYTSLHKTIYQTGYTIAIIYGDSLVILSEVKNYWNFPVTKPVFRKYSYQ